MGFRAVNLFSTGYGRLCNDDATDAQVQRHQNARLVVLCKFTIINLAPSLPFVVSVFGFCQVPVWIYPWVLLLVLQFVSRTGNLTHAIPGTDPVFFADHAEHLLRWSSQRHRRRLDM